MEDANLLDELPTHAYHLAEIESSCMLKPTSLGPDQEQTEGIAQALCELGGVDISNLKNLCQSPEKATLLLRDLATEST